MLEIILLAFIIRLINLNQSLWLDEAISVLTAKNFSFWQILTQFSAKDFNPPLHYLILHFWFKIFPATEFFSRLPSVIFGLLTGFFVYKIYLLIFKDKKGAILTLALLTLSPLHIYYSQEARTYSLTAFGVSASIYYFIKMLKRKNILNTAGYIFYTILMLYSHYLAWLILFTQFIYLFYFYKKKLRQFFSSYLLIILSYLPWFPILFKQLKIGRQLSINNSIWSNLNKFSFKALALLPIKFIIGRNSFVNKNLYFIIVFILVLFFGFIILHLLFQESLKYSPTRAKGKEEKLVWFWLIGPLLMGAVISLKTPVFSYFRFLFCLPAFYFLLSRAILSFKKPVKIMALIFVINLFFSFRYLFIKDFHRENWKQAVAVLHQKNISQSPVLILKNISAPFKYYDKNQSQVVYFQEREIISGKNDIWLIPYSQPIFDPNDITRKFLKKNNFIRVFEKHFRGVTLEEWQKPIAFSYN